MIPFFLCLLIVALPLFFLEAALGQFTGRSPVEAWSFCPLLKGELQGSTVLSRSRSTPRFPAPFLQTLP